MDGYGRVVRKCHSGRKYRFGSWAMEGFQKAFRVWGSLRKPMRRGDIGFKWLVGVVNFQPSHIQEILGITGKDITKYFSIEEKIIFWLFLGEGISMF